MPTVSVIIVNYNGGKVLSRCLDALKAQTRQPDEVLVVDNGSTDGSGEIVTQYKPMRLKELGQNTGFAAANNKGAASLRGDYIALLNPDAYPEPEWLSILMQAAEKYPDVAMFGSTQLNAEQPGLFDGTGDCYHALGVPYRADYGHAVEARPVFYETFAPCAAAALYKREVFLQAGGFDEDFFCYCEDVDLGFRLRLQGHRALQVSRAIVHHHGSGITGGRSDFTVYHSARNRLWVFVKNMPLPLLILLLVPHIAVTLFFWLRFAKAGAGAAYGKGVADGIKGIGKALSKRGTIQRQRKISAGELVKSLIWSPLKLLRREGAPVRVR